MPTQDRPTSFRVELEEGVEAIVPYPPSGEFNELFDLRTPPIMEVMKAPPSATSLELEGKLKTRPFRCFAIHLNDGRILDVSTPGQVSYMWNTFQFLSSPLPREVYRTGDIEHLEDKGPYVPATVVPREITDIV